MSWLSMAVALVVYLVAAGVLVWLFRIWVMPRLPEGAQQAALVALAVVLFTPGFSDDTGMHFGPACIGVLFNVMTHSLTGVLRSLLPLLLVGAVVSAWMWRRERKIALADVE